MENQKHYSNHSQNGYSSQAQYAPTHSAEQLLNTGMLNELLRKQLTPDTIVKPSQLTNGKTAHQEESLISCAVDAVEELLHNEKFDRSRVHRKLSALFYQQKAVYLQTPIEEKWRKCQFISHCGLIMSPDNCITTQLDDIRVRSFIRGIDAAIQEKSAAKQSSNNQSTSEHEPVHVVYPACGPFAPLLMPLLAYYKTNKALSAQQLQITLIDMQPGAISTLEALINEMDISDYIANVCCMDATQYQPMQNEHNEHNGELKNIDLVILEAMQHGLSREGQLSIARHFASLLALEGSFIPKKIIVSANLVIAQDELVEQWRDAKNLSEQDMDNDIKQQRLSIGNVLTISPETLRNMQEIILDEHTHLLECESTKIPELPNDIEYTLLLSTRVQTWGDEWVGEYDSGITHPLPDQSVCINFTPREQKAGDLLIKSGEAIKFYYRLNGLPGFLPTCEQGSVE